MKSKDETFEYMYEKNYYYMYLRKNEISFEKENQFYAYYFQLKRNKC